MNKHPVYGYLTEQEYTAMLTAPYSVAAWYKKTAEKREKEAKKRKNKNEG